MQREKREQRDHDMQLHSKLAAYGSNGGPALTEQSAAYYAKKVKTPKPKGVHIQGEWYEAEDRTYAHTPRQRGLIADFKGDFYNTYKRHTTLTPQQVWHCHNNVFNRRLDLGLTVGTDTAFFEEVIAEMAVFETAR
jgi:hypothetical protein